MTIPAGIGYPDWRRSFATARFFDILAFNTTITQSTNFGPFPVANIDSIGVRCFALTGHGLLTLEWFADEALTFFLSGDQISLREGCAIDQSIVVKGAFLRVTVANVEPADWELTLVLYETTRSVISMSDPTDNVLISQVNQVVAGGATATWDGLRIYSAEAVWSVRSNGTNFNVNLNHVDHIGNVTRIDQFSQANTQLSRIIFLSPCMSRINYVNGDVGNHAVSAFLVAKPGLSGF